MAHKTITWDCIRTHTNTHIHCPLPPAVRLMSYMSPTAHCRVHFGAQLKEFHCPPPTTMWQCTEGIPLPTAPRPLQCATALKETHCPLSLALRPTSSWSAALYCRIPTSALKESHCHYPLIPIAHFPLQCGTVPKEYYYPRPIAHYNAATYERIRIAHWARVLQDSREPLPSALRQSTREHPMQTTHRLGLGG